jgi:hypothetical protein
MGLETYHEVVSRERPAKPDCWFAQAARDLRNGAATVAGGTGGAAIMSTSPRWAVPLAEGQSQVRRFLLSRLPLLLGSLESLRTTY